MSSFHEPSGDGREPRGDGWRRLEQPVTVRGYVAQSWHDVVAVDINDETRELRVEFPPRREGERLEMLAHKVLSPGHYEVAPGALDHSA